MVAYNSGHEVVRHTGEASIVELSRYFEAALSGEQQAQTGPAPLARLLRLVAGGAMIILAFQGHFSGIYLLLAGLSAVIAFSAVYDRCPIYRAVSARLKAWLRKEPASQPRA